MTAAPFLRDLVVLLAAALPMAFLAQTLRLPSVVGFLIAGIAIGPYGAGLIHTPQAVTVLAEFGVVLLLFTIGLESSLTRLFRLRREVLGCGTLQLCTTVAAIGAVAALAGLSTPRALTVGFIGALSSTAIVLQVLAERGELDTPHGQIALGILLFQDVCVVPIMLLLPVLGRPEGAGPLLIAQAIVTAVGGMAAVLFAARILFPRLMRQIVRLRSRELFIGSVVLFCFGTAWATEQLGVSLAIGAFVAGLVISESEYLHQVTAEILPFRDLFNSVFFMSVGMLLDPAFVGAHLLPLAGATAAIIVVKSALGATALMPFRRSWRLAVLVGALVAQVGEFSFVIANEAVRLALLDHGEFQFILAVSVLTMIVSVLVIGASPAVVRRLFGGRDEAGPAEDGAAPAGHVVIVGYGLNGENLARVLRETGIPYRTIDLNNESVRNARERGEPIIFGDATRTVVLRHVHAETAGVIVVAISDAAATRRIVSVAREISPRASLIVRTRYVSEIEELYRLGADEVIPEEFETSVEIFARVLRRMHVPGNLIAMQVNLIRGERYAAMRGVTLPRQHAGDLAMVLEASTTETYLLLPKSPANDRRLADLDLRGHTGTTIIAVVREGHPYTNPGGDFLLRSGDVLVMLGSHAELAAATRLLEPARSAAD